jgi:phage terminase large subunit-like protein
MPTPANKFLELVQNPFKFTFFLLVKLPAAFFSGVRLKYADGSQAIVTVPYKWFSKNPFKSTYFACLSMAAEMSTGILAMAYTYQKEPAISLLVIKTEGTFLKKATGITTFTCEDGNVFAQAVNEAAASGKSTSVAARSTGKDKNGDIVAEFVITWSFKAKSS